MKREPYVITQNLSVQEIVDLVKRAYDEGYADGKADSISIDWGKIVTTPTNPVPPNTTPIDEWWRTPIIYCNHDAQAEGPVVINGGLSTADGGLES